MEKVYSKVSSFVDFSGRERQFAVVLLVIKGGDDVPSNCVRMATGVSFCHTKDTWNKETGIMIATNRARKLLTEGPGRQSLSRGSAIITSPDLMYLITEDSIENVLTKTVEYVKTNPGRFIKGYDEMEKKHLENKAVAQLWGEMTDEERTFLTKVNKGEVSEAYKKFISKGYNII